MRLIYAAFALALLTSPARAQDKQETAHQSSVAVLINGQPISGKVLEIDGKHYVALEDVAQSLRGTISYGDGQVALTLSPNAYAVAQPAPAKPPTPVPQPTSSQVPSVTAQSPETGSIRGTLTYLFDFHTGTKPDAGSRIWLVKGHVEIPADQSFAGTSTALGTATNSEQYAAIDYAVADENGNFEMQDVPTGKYTLVLQSAHTKGTLKEKNHFFSRGNSLNPRDSSGRVESLDLQIQTGETVDASKDFGPNIE